MISWLESIFSLAEPTVWAAWAQAILSALGIYVAIYISKKQHDNDAWRQILASRERRDSILALALGVAESAASVISDFVDDVDGLSDGGPEAVLLDEIFRVEKEMLSNLPFYQLNDAKLVKMIVDLKIIVNIFPELISRMAHGTVLFEGSPRIPATDEQRDAFVKRCSGYLESLNYFVSEVRKTIVI